MTSVAVVISTWRVNKKWKTFHYFLQERQLLWLPVCYPVEFDSRFASSAMQWVMSTMDKEQAVTSQWGTLMNTCTHKTYFRVEIGTRISLKTMPATNLQSWWTMKYRSKSNMDTAVWVVISNCMLIQSMITVAFIVLEKWTWTLGSKLGLTKMLTDWRTDGKPDPYIAPC